MLPPVPPPPDLFLFFPGMNPFGIAAVILGMNLNVGQILRLTEVWHRSMTVIRTMDHGIMLLKVFKVTQTKQTAEATNLDPPLPPPLLSPLPPPRNPATWPANEVEDR